MNRKLARDLFTAGRHLEQSERGDGGIYIGGGAITIIVIILLIILIF